MSRNNAVDIHFFERDAAILEAAHWHAFQIADHLLRIFASMGFYHRDYNVYSLFLEQVSVFEHLISLTDSWRSAYVNPQPGQLAPVKLGEQRFR
jgi:hypothetical protein